MSAPRCVACWLPCRPVSGRSCLLRSAAVLSRLWKHPVSLCVCLVWVLVKRCRGLCHCVSDRSCGILALQVVSGSHPPPRAPTVLGQNAPLAGGRPLLQAALSCVESREDRVCSGPRSQLIPMEHPWYFTHN